jgi:GTP-binding protein HflX
LRLSDTVGFIDRLPHQLVAAFQGTLEEVAGADLLVHVIDAAAPDRQRRIDAVRAVLGEVGAGAVPSIDLYNKIDLMPAEDVDRPRAGDPAAVLLSARTAAGREQLLEAIAAHLHVEDERITLELDAEGEADRRLVNALYRHGKVISHLTEEGRVTIEADVPRRLLGRFTRDKVPA